MNKSFIEWCDQTWNPVTGCLHDCPYCYARRITHRFGMKENESVFESTKIHDIETQLNANAYPYGFDPTFHRYRLGEPQKTKAPQNVFVCSMADLFGNWVPDDWIQEVFEACKKAPQHRYLFLTKNYKRYEYLNNKEILPSVYNSNSSYYFGHSINTQEDSNRYFDWQRSCNQSDEFWTNRFINRFISVEPLQENIDLHLLSSIDWVIIGAETGNRKGKVIPKREWIENIVFQCHSETGHQTVPVFMKDSLSEIWGKPLIQEYPWEVKA